MTGLSANSKWIILDRDGVINQDSDAYIKTPDEWKLIAGSDLAIAHLNKLGYHVAVITNQSGVGRGYFSTETLSAIHQKMHHCMAAANAQISAIYYCPHGPDEGCDCRKPLAGLFTRFACEQQVDLSECYALGDSVRDLRAAHSAGCKPILLRTGKGLISLASIAALPAEHWLRSVPVYDDLAAWSQQLDPVPTT